MGVSTLFQQVLDVTDSVSSNDCVVLLEGESGTGKELLARRIHAGSPRSAGPFIPVNCPGIGESLFESQFYGHVKGAFTGAASDTLGVVRAAEGGTLLLDEVGELPIHLQSKLLRLLQEREVTPVGAHIPISVDTRFVAATNRNLAKCVADGEFRSDLYHRLNIVRIEIPPLRARPADIDPLLDHYLAYYAHEYAMTQRTLPERLRPLLRQYSWPGNVRELCAYVERLYATKLPPIPPNLGTSSEDHGHQSPTPEIPPTGPTETPACCTLAEAEAQTIAQALKISGYNRSHAARILCIHRSTLLRKMRAHGLT